MKNVVAVYVPSTRQTSIPFDSSKYVQFTAKVFAYWFGGASVQPIDGYYITGEGKLVKEPIYRVYSFTDEITDETKQRVTGLANFLKVRLTQESVACEYLTYENEGMVFA